MRLEEIKFANKRGTKLNVGGVWAASEMLAAHSEALGLLLATDTRILYHSSLGVQHHFIMAYHSA